jgi:hypothetical protein
MISVILSYKEGDSSIPLFKTMVDKISANVSTKQLACLKSMLVIFNLTSHNPTKFYILKGINMIILMPYAFMFNLFFL